MAPRGAPSPGRRLPPISPTPSPACPARLRRGALRRVRRTRGPAWRLLAMGPRLPLSRRPQDDGEPQFSLCQAGRAAAGPRRVPSLAKGARSSEPRAFLPPGLLLRLPTATSSVSRRPLRAALSARRVGAQPRRADLLTRVWAARRAALCPRPRPWRVDGRREPGRRAERCAGPGTRPGDRGAAGSLQCASEK